MKTFLTKIFFFLIVGFISNSAQAQLSVTGVLEADGFKGTLTAAPQPNITAVGILTGLTVNGTVTATLFSGIFFGNATTATTAGTVSTAAQPNITSVGTLGSLNVTNTLTSGKYLLGADLSLLPIAGGQSAVSSWWGLQLVGNRQANLDYAPVNLGGSTDVAGVIIPVQQAAKIGVLVLAATSQSGNLLEFRNSAGLQLSSVTSAGTFSGPIATSGIISAGSISATGSITSGGIAVATAGTMVNLVILTSGTTYNVPANVTAIDVEMIGSGGGGGGSAASTANPNAAVGGGGGGGAYTRFHILIPSGTTSYTYAIGAGGAGAVTVGTGVAGGQTQFNGTTYTAVGGGGGNSMATGATILTSAGGIGGAGGLTGDLSIDGGDGGAGYRMSGTLGISGIGGRSFYGSISPSIYVPAANAATTGNVGAKYGSGGGGAMSFRTSGTQNATGGAGAAGVIVIREFK